MRAVAASSISGGSAAVSSGSAAGCGHDELGLAAAQAQLDGARSELAGDLVGGRRERLEQHQPERGFVLLRESARRRGSGP